MELQPPLVQTVLFFMVIVAPTWTERRLQCLEVHTHPIGSPWMDPTYLPVLLPVGNYTLTTSSVTSIFRRFALFGTMSSARSLELSVWKKIRVRP